MSEATDAVIAGVRAMLPDLARDAAAVEINGAVEFNGTYGLRGRDVYAEVAGALGLPRTAGVPAA